MITSQVKGLTINLSEEPRIGVEFVGCELIIDGNPVTLIGCSFQNCQFKLDGPDKHLCPERAAEAPQPGLF